MGIHAPRRASSLYHDRFELGSRLGEGAVGVVFDAFDHERGVRVALKLLRAVQPELLLSFKTEFRAVHGLEHPNLVKLGELFEDAGQWFFTMELVRGEHFLHQTYAEPLLRRSLLQLASGLAALHAARIVHRDVKPSNILVEPRGRVVLLDFGLATGVLNARRSSDDGMRGTVAFMAPEQITGESLSAASDWYAVGVVLYQALCGRLPFVGGAHDMLEQKLTCEPTPVLELAPAAPPDLAALCGALLRIDPAARAGEQEVLRVLAGSTAGAAASLPSWTHESDIEELVGRKAELRTLAEAFAEVHTGQARSVVVQGESGVGKSFLVRTFSERCLEQAPATLLLHGRCYERESVPYKAVDGAIDELGSVLREQPASVLTRLLSDDVGLLASLFPVLGDLPELARLPAHAPPLESAQELRRRAFAALRGLFTRVAAWRPVVLVIDDLQWADADSLALLNDLLAPPGPPALLLLCTRRLSSQGVPAASLPGDVRELELAKLPDADASVLVRKLLSSEDGSEAEVASIARESEGHPLFIAELVRQRRQRVHGEPVRLDDVVRARVQALPPASRSVLAHVCVAGRPLSQEVAAAAAGVEPHELFDIVGQLRAANLLRTAGVRRSDLVEPFHDRVRESVVARLPAAKKREIQQQLAQAFERAGIDDPDALATYWHGAGDSARAAHHAIRAADGAARALAFDRAVRFYQLALELRARPDEHETELLGKLAQALTNAGRGAESAGLCLRMAASTSGAQALDLRRSAAEQFLASGHHDRGSALLHQLCAESGIYTPPRAPFLVVLCMLFVRLVLRLRGLSFRERQEADIERARLARVDLLRAAVSMTMTDHVRGAYFKTLNTLFALAAGEPRRVLYALATEACTHSSAGTPAAAYAQKLLRAAEQLAARSGVAEAPTWLALARGYAAFFTHKSQTARDEFLRAEAAYRSMVGEKFHLVSIRTLLFRILINMGELRDLAQRIGPALREVEARGDVYAEASFRLTAMPILALAEDDIPRARAEMARSEPQLARGVYHVQHYYALVSQLRIELYARRGAEAWQRVLSTWPRLRKSMLLHVQVVRHIALEHRARAALAAGLADAGAASELFEEAERVCRQLERERIAPLAGLATLLRACVADARGEREVALRLLAQADAQLVPHDHGLHLAAVRRRRGELLGGDEGAALIASADAWLAAQGVRDPRRFCGMIYPVRDALSTTRPG
jgi:hypothetical protein